MNKFFLPSILFTFSCANSNFYSATKKYDAAIAEQKETCANDSVRSVTRLFFRTLDIVKKYNLSDQENLYLITQSLKHYQNIYGEQGAWTGEHTESGDEDLSQLCLVVGDHSLSELLSMPDFSRLRQMFKVRPPDCIKHFKITRQLLDSQKASYVPLFDYS
jgi:hypothetical protein